MAVLSFPYNIVRFFFGRNTTSAVVQSRSPQLSPAEVASIQQAQHPSELRNVLRGVVERITQARYDLDEPFDGEVDVNYLEWLHDIAENNEYFNMMLFLAYAGSCDKEIDLTETTVLAHEKGHFGMVDLLLDFRWAAMDDEDDERWYHMVEHMTADRLTRALQILVARGDSPLKVFEMCMGVIVALPVQRAIERIHCFRHAGVDIFSARLDQDPALSLLELTRIDDSSATKNPDLERYLLSIWNGPVSENE